MQYEQHSPLDSHSDLEALLKLRVSEGKENDQEHQRKIDAVRDLYYSLERPGDTAHRLIFQSFQLSCARIGCDIGLFALLAGNDPLSCAEIAGSTGTDRSLMNRLLRYLASNGIIKETSDEKFTSTNITETLALPGLREGLGFGLDCVAPVASRLPAFLQSTSYRSPTSGQSCAWQPGHETRLSAFEWLSTHPAQLSDFNTWMTVQRLDSGGSFLDVFDFDVNSLPHLPEDGKVFVDVGGGVGHQCQTLVARYPWFKGRTVLQDLPHVLDQASPEAGVESMPWDFFSDTPQPVRQAQHYYMRNILHDHPDAECKVILGKLREAMGRGSKLLIDEVVLSERGCHWRAAQLDVLMMSALGAGERTRGQWEGLLSDFGLKIEQALRYAEPIGDSILVAVPFP